jgi:alpha-galactosidase
VLKEQSWPLIRQWLDLLARSGTVLMTSIEPGALGTVQRRDIMAALAIAAAPQPLAEPLDWQRLIYPTHWRLMGAERVYDWASAEGEAGV